MSFKYNHVVSLIKRRIDAGFLKAGAKLPSIRDMARSTGYSNLTVQRAYEVLQDEGYCKVSPRSGFFLTDEFAESHQFPDAEEIKTELGPVNSIANAYFEKTNVWRESCFASPYCDTELFDSEILDAELRRALRLRSFGGAEKVSGDTRLKESLVGALAKQGSSVHASQIFLAGTVTQSLNVCLDALTQRGDTILLESPCPYAVISSVKRRDLKVVEIYAHPIHGVNPEQYDYILRNYRVSLAIMMPNNHVPTGVTYNASTMAQIAQSSEKYGTVVLEDDSLSDLSFSRGRVASIKQFDRTDNVIQIGSLGEVLSLIFGISWILPGRHAAKISRALHLGAYSQIDDCISLTLARYLNGKGRGRRIRDLCATLEARVREGEDLLFRHLPQGCSFTRPTGGYLCWVRIPSPFSSDDFFAEMTRHKVGFIPGTVFSYEHSFSNFFALNFSSEWTEERRSRLVRLCSEIPRFRSERLPALRSKP